MPKKTKMSQKDLTAFHESIKGAKPLIQKKIRLSLSSSARRLVKRAAFDDQTFQFNETHEVPKVGGDELIVYKQDGVSNKTLRKLRKGQYNVDAILDLHGLTADEAKTAVDRYLKQCLLNKIRVALIIHGKGHHSETPVLKNKLNQWLREIDVVLAFCSAASLHGSRGAIYVLLKRTMRGDPD